MLARGVLKRALAIGCALAAVGAMLLVASSPVPLLLESALYGCGLGLSMTCISLIRSRQRPAQRVADLARLNLIWAIGAGCAPPLLLKSATYWGSPAVLHTVATVFLAAAVLVLMVVPVMPRVTDPKPEGRRTVLLHSLGVAPVILLCMIPFATGVESGMSSWLTSYIMRGGYVLSVTLSATTAFGAGLILSRVIESSRTHSGSSTSLALRLHPLLTVVGIGLLMLSQHPLLTVTAALITGFGIGPLYPLLLALLLNHNEAGNLGFVAGGIGASLIPMLTGAVAGWTHSLRTGLSVLLAGAVWMVIASTRLAKSQDLRP